MGRRSFLTRTLATVGAMAVAQFHLLAEANATYWIPSHVPLIDWKHTRFFVDSAVAYSGDGTSPERAYRTISEAVNRIPSGSTILILTKLEAGPLGDA